MYRTTFRTQVANILTPATLSQSSLKAELSKLKSYTNLVQSEPSTILVFRLEHGPSHNHYISIYFSKHFQFSMFNIICYYKIIFCLCCFLIARITLDDTMEVS